MERDGHHHGNCRGGLVSIIFVREERSTLPPPPAQDNIQKKIYMSFQPLGELWICLRPNDYEVRDCGSRIIYQRLIILELIEQFGFDQAVFLLKKTSGESEKIPLVKKYLRQLIHLEHENDYVIIQDVPEVREEHVYRHSWKEGRSIISITFTTE